MIIIFSTAVINNVIFEITAINIVIIIVILVAVEIFWLRHHIFVERGEKDAKSGKSGKGDEGEREVRAVRM